MICRSLAIDWYSIQEKVTNVIPTGGRNLERRGLASPQMLRRCCWLSMTFSYQRQVIELSQPTTINWIQY